MLIMIGKRDILVACDKKDVEKIIDSNRFDDIQRLSRNETGEVYLVQMNREKFVLKLQRDKEKYEREVRALKLLNAKCKQVPTLIEYGENFSKGNIYYFIQHYLEGDTLRNKYNTFSENEKKILLYDAGTLIGNINTICSEEELIDSEIWKYSYSGITNYEKYNWINIYCYKPRKWLDIINFESEEEMALLKEYVSIIEKAMRYSSVKKLGLLHRDFGFRNIIVNNKRISGVIDFEYAALGDIEYDLAKLIFNDIDFSIDKEHRESFFTGWENATNQKVQWNRLWLYLAIQGMGAIQWVDRQEENVRIENQDYRVKGKKILLEACSQLDEMYN